MSSVFINAKQLSQSSKKETEDSEDLRKEYAELAKDCYHPERTDDVNGWKVVEVYDDKTTGFAAKLYEKNGKYVFATAGSNDLKDWFCNNIPQHFGLEAKQYEQSIALAQKLAKEHPNLTFVGHSLGGGLASANARATGCPAILYNASALNNRYNLGLPANITNYISNGDILDYANNIGEVTGINNIFGSKVQGEIIRVDVSRSKMPNLQGVPGTGLYQAWRGIQIHTDINPV